MQRDDDNLANLIQTRPSESIQRRSIQRSNGTGRYYNHKCLSQSSLGRTSLPWDCRGGQSQLRIPRANSLGPLPLYRRHSQLLFAHPRAPSKFWTLHMLRFLASRNDHVHCNRWGKASVHMLCLHILKSTRIPQFYGYRYQPLSIPPSRVLRGCLTLNHSKLCLSDKSGANSRSLSMQVHQSPAWSSMCTCQNFCMFRGGCKSWGNRLHTGRQTSTVFCRSEGYRQTGFDYRSRIHR